MSRSMKSQKIIKGKPKSKPNGLHNSLKGAPEPEETQHVVTERPNRDPLSHLLAYRNGNVHLYFSGAVIGEYTETIDQCSQEISGAPIRAAILNFRDSQTIDKQGIEALRKLFDTIRERSAVVRVCKLNSELETSLLDAGVIKPFEIARTPEDALKALSFKPFRLK
jgi:anti-anti-sigma regulatory factor